MGNFAFLREVVIRCGYCTQESFTGCLFVGGHAIPNFYLTIDGHTCEDLAHSEGMSFTGKTLAQIRKQLSQHKLISNL